MPNNDPYSYILVTRVRDEEVHLPDLFASVFSQTIQPALWLFVDHDSKDRSPELIAESRKGKDWIEVIHLEVDDDYGLYSHARPVRAGFSAALKYASEKGIDYRYIGVLDADIILGETYYADLMKYMETNPQTGIVSGLTYYYDGVSQTLQGSRITPAGGSRLYTRECFEAIGGEMPESAIWDSETNIMAENRGWKLHVLEDVRVLHKRQTFTRKGIMRGYWRRGKGMYFAHYHPVAVLLMGISYLIKPPFIISFSFLLSYLVAWITKGDETKNPEVREYCWNSYSRFRCRVKNRIFGFFRRKPADR